MKRWVLQGGLGVVLLCLATTLGTPLKLRRPVNVMDTLGPSVIAQAFQRQGATAARAAQVARVVWDESERQAVDPLLVAAIITVENPTLVPRATSSRGAVGIMQVMPFWHRSFRRSCGGDVTEDHTNICMGIRVFQTHLTEARGSLTRSLLAYSGCRVTPGCGRYATVVLRRHQRLQVAVANGGP